MRIRPHGGWCCGIVHINEIPFFTNKNTSDFKNLLKRNLSVNNKGNHNLIEVVLTDKKDVRWHNLLKELRFKEVSRFTNPSTGNQNIIYHYYKEIE